MLYTRKQCKDDMIKLWEVLAETGFSSKYAAALKISLDFARYINGMQFRCPCCMLVDHFNFNENCHLCPINWGVKPIVSTATCTISKSPFNKWKYARTINERKYYANRILILAYMIRI